MRRYFALVILAAYWLCFSPVAAGEYPVEQWAAWHEQATGRCPGSTWLQYANPEDAGWSAAGLEEAKACFDSLDAAAAIVVYDGAVLAAWGEVDRRFPCHSVRKSLLSAVFGIHITKGDIDLDKTLAELGIDDNPPLSDGEKQARVIDLLRSRSGIYHPAAYETAKMKETRPKRDSVRPGEVFWYNNWDFNALCTILERETGTRLFEQFEQHFARPLEMQDFRLQDTYYHLEKEHSMHPAYPFRMSARDLARIGLLYEREGRWGDEQILPAEWIRKSVESHFTKDDTTGNRDYGYGYLWWPIVAGPFKELGMFSARGYGGHAIDVVPAADLVLVLRVDTYWDLPLPFPSEKHQVETSDRFELLGKILAARTGPAKAKPKLVPLADTHQAPTTIQIPAETLAKYVGRYELEGDELTVKTTAGGLLIGTPSVGDFSLLPVSETDFLMEDVEVPLTFELDSEAKPVRLGRTAEPFDFEKASRDVPKPRELWPTVMKHAVPHGFTIKSDELVTSDTDPSKKLRKVTGHLYSQILDGKKWGHQCVIFLPADPKRNATPERKGKVVIIGSPGATYFPIHVAKYGEPIAARTDYPTMVLSNPGEYADGSQIERDIRVLTKLRLETGENYFSMNCQLAVVYIKAMDAFQEFLGLDTLKAVVGGHSKRGRSATVAAAVDSRVASPIIMGNEGVYSTDSIPWHLSFHHAFFQDQVNVPVFYLGATNEDGYKMFNVNILQERLKRPMTIELIPNYCHSNFTEIQFMDFLMWVSHIHDGRPITQISEVSHERQEGSSLFRAKVESEAKVQMVRAWYVYSDDEAWRDLMWYHLIMEDAGNGYYQVPLQGKIPDAFMIEVGDIALGIPGYVTSLPQKLTDAPVVERVSRGSRPRLWEPEG